MDGVFLELLLSDAPSTEYDAAVRRARDRGAGPDTMADWERARILALRLRTRLARHRRRENELSALFETANDLAGLRELDAVLQAIVRRARRLLDTDVAYMTLEDPARGDTFMRVTDGSVAATFQRLRLPMGAGLGGLVAQTDSPYSTEHYLADPRFRHTGDIDTGVQDEGLDAILGVPLRLGSRVIGVLFAADRQERRFVAEEVALLASLADHAAVALDNARMLQETRAALTELDEASRLGRARAAATERAATAHDRLTRVVLRGGDLDELTTAVTEVLSGSLSVLDADGAVLAGMAVSPDRVAESAVAPDDAAGSAVARQVSAAVATSRSTGRACRSGPYWVAAVAAGPEHLGALVLRPDSELDDADQRTLERAALVTALLLLFRHSTADAQARVGADLLADILLAPRRDPTGLRDRARRLGVDLSREHLVLTVAWTDRPQQSFAVLPRLAADRSGLATRHDGREVLLLPGSDPSAMARAVASELRQAATVAAAGPATGTEAIARAHREATGCLDAALALGRHGTGVSMADLGFLGLVLGEHGDPGAFLHATIGAVLDYDRDRGTQLAETLDAYFAAGRSPTRARIALHVHANTVNQRLERVAQLLGPRWQEPAQSLEIQLALRLRHAYRPDGRR